MPVIDAKPLLQRLAYYAGQYKRHLQLAVRSGRYTGEVTLSDLAEALAPRCGCAPATLESGAYREYLRRWLDRWHAENDAAAAVRLRLQSRTKAALIGLVADLETEVAALRGEAARLRTMHAADRAELAASSDENARLRKTLHSRGIWPT
ncbi:MAG TPA: hypothetical protein VFC93_15820 [Chloroflexota bacterium]|nr:hypothetical protein [Chloroflexota bacterium]